jgi:hypothetical protein
MKAKIVFLLTVLAASGLCACGSDGQTAATPGVPGGYQNLCGKNGVTCQEAESPPNMVGTYTGTGKTVETTNSLWSVDSTADFSAVIATQNGETASGTFDIDEFHLDVKQATIRGTETRFTIYDTDSAIDGDCSLEATVVITGTLTNGASTTTAEGRLVLEFTKNIQGTGCTADQMNKYPGTGAVFEYTATRTP